MIQRKQSLWFLLSAIASFCSIAFPFYTGNKMGSDLSKNYNVLNAQLVLPILILTIVIATASLIIIFLYKERKKQMLFTFLNLLLSILLIFLYYSETKKFVDGTLSMSAILVFVNPIALIFAFVGIFNDEKLIKSVDRIR